MGDFTPFASPTGIRMNNQGFGEVQYGSDKDLLVNFYMHATPDPIKSKEAGRPIYVDVEHVKIQHPGERYNIIDRPASETDKRRFSMQYQAFLHNKTQVPDGTPIDLLFPNNPSVAENLRSMGIFTIEQCSKLSAHAIDSIGMGGQEYVNKANAYLKSSEAGVSFHKMSEALKERDQKIKIMTEQLQAQKAQIDDLVRSMGNLGITNQQRFNPVAPRNYDVQAERINANTPTAQISAAHRQVADINDDVFADDKSSDDI